ncbi:MAG: hypothetical protein IKF14_13435 [Atopobiaceae bacterium]|nr:hypothetical protein [Atopobiaceae bacterium]
MSENTRTGITFLDLLAVMFIAFKIVGVVDWPWWVVLMPIWVPFAIGVVLFIVIAIANS